MRNFRDQLEECERRHFSSKDKSCVGKKATVFQPFVYPATSCHGLIAFISFMYGIRNSLLAFLFSFLIGLYIVFSDERDLRKGSHLLEGEFTGPPDVYINLMGPICTYLHCLLTTYLQG